MKEAKEKRGAILAIANQKGGVGKSLSTVNLACAFGQLGLEVLLVDADYQGNASTQIGIKKQATELEKTIFTGLMEDTAVSEIWLKTKFQGVYAVGAIQEFSEFNIKFLTQPGAHALMKEWLASARKKFDLIIIDTHPSLDLTFQNVMVAADYYILPLFAEVESLEGLHVMFKHVRTIKEKLNPTLHILGCFLTKFDKTIKTHQRFKDTIEAFGKKIGMPMMGIVPFSKAAPASSENRIPVVISQPKIPISEAYITLAKKLRPELKSSRRGRTPNTPEVKKGFQKEIEQSILTSSTPLIVETGANI